MKQFLQLYITESRRAARSIEMTSTTTIGRDSDNDIVLDELTVSRCHALLFTRAGHIAIMDLESANGTFVNGVQVPPDTPVRLADGDIIQLGHVSARYIEVRTVQDSSSVYGGAAYNLVLAGQ